MKTSPDPPFDLGPQNILIRIWMDKKTGWHRGYFKLIYLVRKRQTTVRAGVRQNVTRRRPPTQLKWTLLTPSLFIRNRWSTRQVCLPWRDSQKLRWNSGWSGFGIECNPFTQERHEAKLLSGNLVQSMPDNGWQSSTVTEKSLFWISTHRSRVLNL